MQSKVSGKGAVQQTLPGDAKDAERYLNKCVEDGGLFEGTFESLLSQHYKDLAGINPVCRGTSTEAIKVPSDLGPSGERHAGQGPVWEGPVWD